METGRPVWVSDLPMSDTPHFGVGTTREGSRRHRHGATSTGGRRTGVGDVFPRESREGYRASAPSRRAYAPDNQSERRTSPRPWTRRRTPSTRVWEEFVAFRSKLPLAIGGTVAGLMVVAISPMAFGAVSGQAADTQAPTSPTNVKVGKVTETTVELSWTASKDNVGVVAYQIMKQGQQLQELTNVTKTTITKLTPGKNFVLTVVARDKAGNVSPDSAEATATTLPSNDKTAPAVPGGLKVTGTTASNVSLSWSAVKDDKNGIGLDGYNIYVDGAKTASSEETSATIGNLDAGKTYTFQ